MKAAILKEPLNITLEDYPLRKLERNEVIVKVNYCGVCGTDKHIFEGNVSSSYPVIMGHEFAGEVIDKFNDDTNVQIGDFVAIDPNISCGYCKYCKSGKINHCENLIALGVTQNGGFAENVIVPVSQLYSVPKNFDLSLAAFAEPLSCCLHGIQKANIKYGDSVVIIGGGSIGLMMVQLAKLSGAFFVILVEPVEFKQKLGIELGADIALDPNDPQLYESILDYTNGGSDVVIECVGKRESVELSVNLVSKAGRVVIFGLSSKDEKISFTLQHLFRNEISIFNSYLNPFTFNTAVELIVAKKINVEPLITEQICLENCSDIFKSNGNAQNIKCQVITKNKEESC